MQVLWAPYLFDLIHRLDGWTARASEEHAAILDRVAAGDAEGAVAAVQRHIETGWAELQPRRSGLMGLAENRLRAGGGAAW